RFVYGYDSGDEVTAYYDSMMAKVIVWYEIRQRAIEKMLKTLDETVIFGVQSNIPLLKQILTHPDFVNGEFTTQFMGQYFPNGGNEEPMTEDEESFAQMAFQQVSQGVSQGAQSHWPSPWNSGWRNL
ncbi:MAG: acetyl-CoA carboxylase biotin carboxylase subunit, partial [Bdellovibrionales bacterium]|nr:acetyl-CoA carboxylase biotin carboxylase subunit [Bdellovibrionales bacterium]